MYIKSFFSIFILLTFCGIPVFAQYDNVQETQRTMSFGSRPCFRLDFGNTDASLLEDQWRDYVKSNFRSKMKRDRKSDELTASELKSDMMGPDPFAIYSTIEKTDRGSALNIWVDAGAYFLNRRDNQAHTEAFSKSLHTFYYEVRRNAIGKELKGEEDKLKEMESRQKRLQKDNDGMRKDIENYKARIKKAEDDIVKNEKDQEAILHDSETQKKVIEEVKRRQSNVENERN